MRYQEPQFLPWDGRRVPLTFIGGYLGAGKTTLINEVLARTDRPIAVLVNDVGEVNIDASLVRKRSGDTIELTDGCVCCSLVEGFGAAIDQIRARELPPDHVVVELSGLAQPDRVLPWGQSAGLRLDGVVILVAADQVLELLDDDRVADAIRGQIAAADLLVITKEDLVSESRRSDVATRLRAIAPATPAIDVADASDAADLLRLGSRRPGGTVEMPAATLFDLHTVESRALPVGISREQLDTLLDALEESVVRAKGIARLDDGSSVLVQIVGRRRAVTPLPAAEAEAPTPLVVIRMGPKNHLQG